MCSASYALSSDWPIVELVQLVNMNMNSPLTGHDGLEVSRAKFRNLNIFDFRRSYVHFEFMV